MSGWRRRARRRSRVSQRVADVLRVGCRREAPVAAPVYAAREPRGLVWLRLYFRAVEADRRRADEPLARRVALRLDLAHDHRPRVDALLGEDLAQLRERLLVRRAASPEQELHTHTSSLVAQWSP